MEQDRRDERIEMEAEVRFRYPEVFTGHLRNLSSGGMGARIPVTIEVNSPVEVEFFNCGLLACGHVRWVSHVLEEQEIGIQFRESDRQIISQNMGLCGESD